MVKNSDQEETMTGLMRVIAALPAQDSNLPQSPKVVEQLAAAHETLRRAGVIQPSDWVWDGGPIAGREG